MNTTSTSALDTMGSQIIQSSENFAFVTAMVSTIQIGILGLLVIFIESPLQPVSISGIRKTVMKPANLLLLLLIISNFICIGSNYLSRVVMNRNISKAYFAVSTAGLTMFEILTILYTWNRGRHILQSVIPNFVPCVRPIIVFNTLLLITGNCLEITIIFSNDFASSAQNCSSAIQVCNFVLMCGFDVFIAACFGIYLRTLKTMKHASDAPRFKIISSFGIATSFCMVLWFASMSTRNWVQFSNGIGPTLLDYTSNLMPLGYTSLQLAMKWTLHEDRKREIERKKETVMRAKQVVNELASMSNDKSQKDEVHFTIPAPLPVG
ncbi:hypothetical protein BC830DRAFT_661064 [Chytriomyces sp. MP71]|nr:hypothetical protein BC830DRAFT_661064 [Chytriomyces sp. MP71]